LFPTTSSFTDFTPWPRRQDTSEQNSYTYLSVAHELKWITPTVEDIGDVLRDYRNYIHPHKQYSEKVSLAPEDAKILWEISKNITRQLLTIPSTP
jgi:hypothetical protein